MSEPELFSIRLSNFNKGTLNYPPYSTLEGLTFPIYLTENENYTIPGFSDAVLQYDATNNIIRIHYVIVPAPPDSAPPDAIYEKGSLSRYYNQNDLTSYFTLDAVRVNFTQVEGTAPYSNIGAQTYPLTITNSAEIPIGNNYSLIYDSFGDQIMVFENSSPYIEFTRFENTFRKLNINSLFTVVQKPITVPGKPTNIDGTSGNEQITVSWTPPASDGGSTITGYTVYSYIDSSLNGSEFSVGTGTSYIYAGLTNGVTYTFKVSATNFIGEGPISDDYVSLAPAAPTTVPDPPTNVQGTPGNQEVTVSWLDPDYDGGQPILGYKVSAYLYSISSLVLVRTDDIGFVWLKEYIFGSLTNGTEYKFTVQAYNSEGDSLESNLSGIVIPAGPPGTPSITSAVPGNGSVTLNWTAPSSNGADITNYRITIVPGVAYIDTNSDGTTYVYTGLDNGTPYQFTVTAENSFGFGESSSYSIPITPATVPNAPLNVNATRGNGEAFVSWQAPSNGGSAITNYTIEVYDGDTLTFISSREIADVTSYTYTELTNGSIYVFKVKAKNVIEYGELSEPSNQVTPATVPGAPAKPTGTRGDTQINVSWSAPTDTGGNAIQQYRVRAFVEETNVITAFVNAPTTSFLFTDLTNGTSYTFTVEATTEINYGPASVASDPVIPARVPDAPTDLSVLDNQGVNLVIGFTAEADGGLPITNYKYSINNGSSFSPFSPSVTTSPVTITGLSLGTTYEIKLRAVNAVGESDNSEQLSVTTESVPTPPTSVSAVAGTGEATITWVASSDDGGAAIDYYRITRNPGSVSSNTSNGSVTSFVFGGLTNGTAYTFDVAAHNENGFSATATTNSVQPYVYSNAVITPRPLIGGNYIKLWWDPPSFPGPAVTGYTITCPTPSYSNTFSASSGVAYLTNLSTATAYTFTITTKVGDLSVGSNTWETVTTGVQPGNVTGLSGTLNGSVGANITWTPTLNDGGSPIKHQVVSAYAYSNDVAVPEKDIKLSFWPYTTSAYVYPFETGYTYKVQVQAVNDSGYSLNPTQITFTP